MSNLINEVRHFLEYQQEVFGNTWIVPPTIRNSFEKPTPEIVANTPEIVANTPYQRLEALIPDDSPLKRMRTLAEVREYVANTKLIPLDETRRNPVFGVGNEKASVMVIGEAPGAHEDAQGEPFVGEAGQLLNKILAAVQFSREEMYIANILKSRPPNNRDPQPDEIAAHIPILYKQISLIQPKMLLCMGRIAGQTLLQTTDSLTKIRGRFHDFHGLPLMITYHPAALLRNPEWKRPTWEDVQLFRKQFDSIDNG